MKTSTLHVSGRELHFEQTVPCQLTHRRAVGEVFVTDSAQLGPDTFVAAIQLPRAHSLWGDQINPFVDTLAIVEAGRQVTFLSVHRYLAVPLGLPFILSQVEFRVIDSSALRERGGEPFEALVRFGLTKKSVKQGVLTSMSFQGEVIVADSLAMKLGGELQFVPRSDYDMLRAFARAKKKVTANSPPRAPAPIEPSFVGRRNRQNIAIGEGHRVGREHRYPIVVDQGHPAFFDHPQDHLPGPLILEAYRQAAIRTAVSTGALSSPSVVVTSGELLFSEFGEFEAVVECGAEVLPGSHGEPVQVQLALHQLGSQIATAKYELSPVAEAI